MSAPNQDDRPDGAAPAETAGAADRAPPGRAVPPRDARAFDAWLAGHLRHLHAAVLAEPVPEHLLRLLQTEGRRSRLP